MFESVPTKQSFPNLELDILKFWQDNNIFQKSIDSKDEKNEFIFYDGPPFATGLPHYGHLLTSIIKDIIPRYQTMQGKKVKRRFGWDCHGLPVEMEMQTQLNLKSGQDIIDYGIDKFNEACRSIVLRYTSEWEKTIKRIGRWVDFKNDYKTMDLPFMESIWWVFKTLYDKGLIYEGFKVLPYSWKAGTSLSNFEANLNYKDVQDPAITVKFPMVKEGQENTYLLAWTTTPWTLISNLALCVNAHLDYLKVKPKNSHEVYIVAKTRAEVYFDLQQDAQIIEELKGSELSGIAYSPLFPYAGEFAHATGLTEAYSVLTDDFVSDSDGTGIVHLAPAYGEDDYRVGQKHGIGLYDAVDENGNFKKEIDFIEGLNIKEADKKIIKRLKENNFLLKHETINHNYPFCWRTDTPLIYKAISTWFVKVEVLKDNIVRSNKTIHWVPGHVKDGRFGKWLENARDWDIGRNRFWGTPLPIWKSDDGEILCFGDIKSLENMSGQTIEDLHKHFIDKVTFTHQGKVYRRVEQVLDCWFESGSMPYAQNHYPFENKILFEKNFPADFIAEGLEQTRGWFYTLSVISSGLMQEKPFKNVIVNGLILGEDGKKMSKRLKNYPDPNYILDAYGADALRLYLVSSGVVCGEYLKFSEEGVKNVLKTIILPLWNSFDFFISYANIDGYGYRPLSKKPHSTLDRWILSYLEQLNKEITESMGQYELKKSVPPIIVFIDKLTNWYIRRSRRRFWKSENDKDKEEAYYTLYTVLLKLSKLLAPFMPFVSEKIYLVLTQSRERESVHLEDYPATNDDKRDFNLEAEMHLVQRAVALGRSLRARHQLKTRQPLSEMIIITRNESKKSYFANNTAVILDELNIKKLTLSDNEEMFLTLSAKANFKTLGKSMGSNMKPTAEAIAKLDGDVLATLERSGKISIEVPFEIGKKTISLNREDVLIQRTQKDGMVALNEADITVVLNTELTSALIEEGIARDFINRIQKERKENNFEYTDRIEIKCNASESLKQALERFKNYIQKEVLAEGLVFIQDIKNPIVFELSGETCRVSIAKK